VERAPLARWQLRLGSLPDRLRRAAEPGHHRASAGLSAGAGRHHRADSDGTWQRYLTANLLHSYAEVLPAAYDRARFEYTGRALQGLEAQRSRDLRATNAAEGALGDILGKLYVERHFDAQARQRMQELVDNLTAAFRVGIDGLEWMGEETKRDAHAKLDAFNTKIGHPDSWRDYSGLEVRAGDALGNAMRARLFGHQRMTSRLGHPVDRDEWFMSPQTVNAYYSATLNEIVFPAGILQPPFFNVTRTMR
jgi:putative endopeptidase